MADLGEVALRLLDPRWSTLRGTVREWTADGMSQGWFNHGRAHLGPGVPAMWGIATARAMGSVGPSGSRDVRQRITRRRADGAFRSEQLDEATGEPGDLTINGPDGCFFRPAAGGVRRFDLAFPQADWTTETAVLLGLYRLDLTDEGEVAGRPVRLASGRARPSQTNQIQGGGHFLVGFRLGLTCELAIDAATGLCLRFATHDGGRLVALREFVELEVDPALPEGTFTYELGPGERFRTQLDDQLDALRSTGADLTGLDLTDEVAVQEAMIEHQQREAERHGGFRERPLSELVAPLGPPPADPEAARAAIADALAGLGSDDDRSLAEVVDHGDLLDAQGPQPPHPMVGDQRVAFSLEDLAWVRDDEAMIAFIIRLSGGGRFPTKGRAVRRGERWLLAYETWAGLQQMGGLQVPSLLDHPEEGP